MENDALKFRVFIPVENRYMDNKIDNPIIDSSGNLMWCYLDKIGNLKRYEHNLLNRERAVIERCTGLRDRNNKLIYEGDVLVFVNGATHPIIVTWDGIGWKFIRNGKRIEDAFECNTIKHISMCEIIGNIHGDQFRDAAKLIYGEKE